eukprot:13881550-Ditylum_brightwellii.AAC.1
MASHDVTLHDAMSDKHQHVRSPVKITHSWGLGCVLYCITFIPVYWILGNAPYLFCTKDPIVRAPQ